MHRLKSMSEVVVISGSTVGVGRAVARRFARNGAKIAILARGPETFRTTAVELVELGAEAAFAIPCDVDDAAAVDAATTRIEQELGPIDVWVDVDDKALPARERSYLMWGAIAAASLVALVGIGLLVNRARG